MRCYFCLVALPEPSVADMIEAEIEFRKNFPRSWHDDRPDRVCMCNQCYLRILATEDPGMDLPDWDPYS